MNLIIPGATPFHGLAANYARSRQPFPVWVMEILAKQLPKDGPLRILDAGCGTGISTRQMAHTLPQYEIVGVDSDPDMLRQAQTVPAANVSYMETDLSLVGIRFDENSCSGVTAFSSMHWFWENAFTMSGLIRLLCNRGCFFAVNKNVLEEVIPEWPYVLQRWTKGPVRRRKEDYNPDVVLRAYGLETCVVSRHEEESYASEQAFYLLQSSSLWNQVPEDHRASALLELKQLVERRACGGKLIRHLTVAVVFGICRG